MDLPRSTTASALRLSIGTQAQVASAPMGSITKNTSRQESNWINPKSMVIKVRKIEKNPNPISVPKREPDMGKA